MRVIWTTGAVRSLLSIRGYIESDNPSAAVFVAQRIKQAVRNLESFPHAGRQGLRGGTRELVIAGLPYLVVYQVTSSDVRIIRLLHSSQERH